MSTSVNLESAADLPFPFTDISVPKKFADHPLVKDRLFFTLPPDLLSKTVAAVGEERFDPLVLDLESELSERNGSHTSRVGFRGSRPIVYTLLHREPMRLSKLEAARIGLESPGRTADFIDLANDRVGLFIDSARGYCGWLLTNRAFRQEHALLLRTWQKQVAKFGTPQGELVVLDRRDLPKWFRKTQDRTTDFAEAFGAYCARWRLSSITAPYLPTPLMPQLPATNALSLLGQMQDGGMTFYMPDIFPVPSREEQRTIMEECAGRDRAQEHLRDWHKIAASSNTGKHTIARFARIFELQHFWRALQQRHTDALRRATGKLEQVFADYFDTSVDTMHKDLAFISGRLGKDWVTQD